MLQGKIIDLTQTINTHSAAWDLDCGFCIETICDYDDCDTDTRFLVQKIATPAGIGTHIDAPAHCIANGMTVSEIAISKLIAPARVIDVSGCDATYQVSLKDIKQHEQACGPITTGSFVCFHTGWFAHWHNPQQYRNQLIFPSVSPDVAHYLVDKAIVGIGIDTLSPDTEASGFPVHQILLSQNDYIVENLTNLHQLPKVGAQILIMPIKISAATEAPARVIALID